MQKKYFNLYFFLSLKNYRIEQNFDQNEKTIFCPNPCWNDIYPIIVFCHNNYER